MPATRADFSPIQLETFADIISKDSLSILLQHISNCPVSWYIARSIRIWRWNSLLNHADFEILKACISPNPTALKQAHF